MVEPDCSVTIPETIMKAPKITRRKFTRGAALAAAGVGACLKAAADEPRAGMSITVLGDSTCIPDVGHEAACLLIDGKHLVDTGWCAALKMRQYGFDPRSLESIILTHFHQDHYIGLPQLLFFVGLRKRQGPPLKIIGPDAHLEKIVNLAVEFLQTPRFPEIEANYELVPIKAGDRFAVSDLQFETMAARHVSGKNVPEQAMVYKVVNERNGACAVLTGDTSYHPPIAEFAKGVPLLVHDGAHTAARDAATVAKQAGVGRLVLIHYSQARADRILSEAQAVFPNTELAREGSTLNVPVA